MAPIRVGFIGLSSTTSWAVNSHFQYLKSTSKYQIVALLNSSIESAEAAIQKHGLPESTKAYGDPEHLAQDKDVDLVVCSVRAHKHFASIKPSIIAGKAIYVEWPMDKDLQTAQEMAALVKKHGNKTVVGLQGSFAPTARKIKTLLDEKVLGGLLSSSFYGPIVSIGNATQTVEYRMVLERYSGTNAMVIHIGHQLEYLQSALGPFTTLKSTSAIRRSEITLVDPNQGNKVLETVKTEVPNYLSFHGNVSPSNAPVVFTLTGGPPVPHIPALDWRLQFENGWIRVTSSTALLLHGADDTKIEIFDLVKGTEEVVHLEEDEFASLPWAARNIARLYEAFADGDWVPDFEHGLKMHERVQGMWNDFDEAYGNKE